MRPSGNPTERWLAYREVNPRARMRMFCFPYAGGGASAYRGWGASLPADVEVCPVQLPGPGGPPARGAVRPAPSRWSQAIADALPAVLRPAVRLLRPQHGAALIGFELARELRRRGQPLPLHLFVSGRRAPQLPAREEPIHDLPEPEFIEQAAGAQRHARGGAPARGADAAADPHPARRLRGQRDLRLHRPRSPFDFGISAFGGLGDEDVTREDVAAWQEHTRGRFRMRMLPGDHFFVHGAEDMVLEAVARDLAEIRPRRSATPGDRLPPALRSPAWRWTCRAGRDPRLGRPRSIRPPSEVEALGRCLSAGRVGAGEPLPLRQAPAPVRGRPRRPAHPARPPTWGRARSR